MRTATAIGLGLALLLATSTRGQDTKTTTEAKANEFEGAYTIVSGETSPDKVLRVPLSPEDALRRWASGWNPL